MLLLCNYDEEGAFGVIINRIIDMDIQTLLEQVSIDIADLPTKATMFGGPVQLTSCRVLYEGERTFEAGDTLYDQSNHPITISPSLQELQRLIDEKISFEIIIGYSGWGPEQLDKEIAEGSWLYTDISPTTLLSVPPSERYQFALKQLEIEPKNMWQQSIEE